MKNKILLGVSGVKGVKTIVFLFLSLLMILPLSSCYNKENREEILKVYNWADYIDEDVLANFPKWYEQQTGKKIRIIYQTFDINEASALTHDQQEQLFHKIEEDYQDIPLKADRMKAIRQDPYFNALQVKFAYAVTCHKAQGGQWSHVYVDQGYMTDEMLTPDYIHWLYTAFTRATEMLYLVNWPKTQVEGE
jgi:hypothetical protein